MNDTQTDLTYTTYPTGGVIMEARFYSFNELRDLLSMAEQMNAHIEKAMRDSK